MAISFEAVWALAVVKAWKEPHFKKVLVSNPAEALSKHFGYTLPNNFQLTIEEGQAGQPIRHVLTLPPKPDDMDLTDPAALKSIMEIATC